MALLTLSRTRRRSSESRNSRVRDSTTPCRFAVRDRNSSDWRLRSISEIVEVARTRRIPMLLRPGVRLSVDDAKRPQRMPFGADQRHPRIGYPSELGDGGVSNEIRIQPGVRHDQGFARRHGVLAERVRQGGLPCGRETAGHAALTLEELPSAVHQRNGREGRTEQRWPPGASAGRRPPREGNREATYAAMPRGERRSG